MRKIRFSIIAVVSLLVATTFSPVNAKYITQTVTPVSITAKEQANEYITVYITETGECYHSSECRYAKISSPISLQDAVEQGYRACKICKP